MSEKLNEFKECWSNEYGYIELNLTDEEIESYINRFPTIQIACNMASDYLLSQGLSEVQE